MSRTNQSVNTTHRKRLARRYAEATGLPYQQALDTVIAVAESGVLPTPLDPSGMNAALLILTTLDSFPESQRAGATMDAIECVYCHTPLRYDATEDLWVSQSLNITQTREANPESEQYDLFGCDPQVRGGGPHAYLAAGWHTLGVIARTATEAGDTDADALHAVRAALKTAAADGVLTDSDITAWAKRAYKSADNIFRWAVGMKNSGSLDEDFVNHLLGMAGGYADQFAAPLAADYTEALTARESDVDGVLDEYHGTRSGWSHIPAPHWLRTVVMPAAEPETATRPDASVSANWSPAKVAREEQRLLDLLNLQHGRRVYVAGIVECLAALSLAIQGKVIIEDPTAITSEGGSGWICSTEPQPDTDSSGRLKVWFVAHEGNLVPRCTGSSWRGSSRRGKKPYGPGGFNRCVKADGHAPEQGGEDTMHVDEWGHVFRTAPKFRVVRNLTNAEMAEVARESGMTVGTSGSIESKADALQSNTLWMTAEKEMVKVSNHYTDEGRITAQVVYPVSPRTTVRSYTLSEAALWKSPSAAQMRKYERAWGFED